MTDFRFALRQLLKNPAFTAVAVLTLALGIGANTAMFSVINAVLLRPLPFSEADQLIAVWQEYPKRGWSHETFSLPNLIDLRNQTNVFADAGAYSLSAHTLTGVDEPARFDSVRMSASLLPTLGVQLVHGRNFSVEEDRPDAPRVALLSDHLWRQRFRASPAVIGQTIRLNDESVMIVGILPATFRLGAEKPDLCLPLRLDPAKIGRGQRGLSVIARLRSGVEATRLRAALASVAAQLRAADSRVNADLELSAAPLHEEFVDSVRLSLWLLGGAVGCVLLIACANVANLSLARAFSRRQELIIRAAIGSGRWRIVRQLLTENLVLSMIGGSAGIVLASWVISVARNLLVARLPQASEFSLDGMVLGFSLAASVLTGILCGLLPALSASRADLADGLKEGTRTATAGVMDRRMRGALVAAEVSLAFVLLVSAGLLLKSLDRLLAVNPGFDPSHLLAVQTTLTGNRYNFNGTTSDPFPTRRAVANQMMAELENIPGVQAVTFGTSMPLEDEMDASGAALEGKFFGASDSPFVHLRGVRANYFQVLRTRLLEGRHLMEADHAAAEKVALINRTMALQYWPGESPIGKRIRPDALQTTNWLTVVGVVEDMKNESLSKGTRPELYYAYAQFPTRGMCALLRASVPPQTLAEPARRAIWKVDGTLAIVRAQPMQEAIRHSANATHLQSLLLGCFAALALLLAAVGIYSVLACSVTQRSREMGIRMALGAQSRNLYALILRSGLKPVFVGLGIGIPAALALTRFLSKLLFEVATTDLATFSGVTLILGLTALMACLAPARRATKVNPIETLRHE